MKKIFNFIDEKTNEYVEFLKDICSFEGRAFNKDEIDKMADYIEKFSINKGFSVKRIPFEKCGDFLIIDINDGAEKGNVFLAHMDTVFDKGAFGIPAVKVNGDVINGPGVIDCKGGIAIALLVMESLLETGYDKHTRIILNSDEEVSNSLGGIYGINVIKDYARGFKNALNCEVAENNQIAVSRSGILNYRIEIKGKGGHSGIDYFNCSNAVLEAAHKIIELEKYSKNGKSTYSCNIISGGSTLNIIPDKCSFYVNIRVVDREEMDYAKKVVEDITNTSFISGTESVAIPLSNRLPMVMNKDTENLFNELQKVSMKYDLGTLEAIESGGGSDAAYTQAAGVPTVCGTGAIGGFCHTTKEYIEISSIPKRAKLLTTFSIEM